MTDKKFEIRVWVDKIERFKYITVAVCNNHRTS